MLEMSLKALGRPNSGVRLHRPPGAGGQDTAFLLFGSLPARASAVSGFGPGPAVSSGPTCSATTLPTVSPGDGQGLMQEWLFLLIKPATRSGLGCLDSVLWYSLSSWGLTVALAAARPSLPPRSPRP